MSNPDDTPGHQRRHREYEDPHFHNDDEVAPVEDHGHEKERPPTPRRPPCRLPPRRRYHED